MESDEECGFAGDVFLRLAAEGALVLDPEHADRVIAGLTATLAEVIARGAPTGLLGQAVVELPKYIEAFRVAKRSGTEFAEHVRHV